MTKGETRKDHGVPKGCMYALIVEGETKGCVPKEVVVKP